MVGCGEGYLSARRQHWDSTVKASGMNDEQLDGEQHQDNAPATPRGNIRAFHLRGSGIRRVLGSLQADVLEAVWAATAHQRTTPPGWATIGAVSQRLGPTTNYRTVQTVMNRLVEKGLLLRREQARAYEYQAALSRDALMARVTHEIVQGLIQEFGEIAVAQLVQTLQEVSPEHLELLEQLAAGEGTDASQAGSGSATSGGETSGSERLQRGADGHG